MDSPSSRKKIGRLRSGTCRADGLKKRLLQVGMPFLKHPLITPLFQEKGLQDRL